MKYALVNGQRQEAQSGLSGFCPACGSLMVPKCGDVRIHHWAHTGKHNCDHWWEPETEWHRGWKNMFPEEWQEFIQTAESGEKHIADVMTDQGWVIEFQHSKIDPAERKARETFYKKMIWIVDGTRRKRDKAQFFTAREDHFCADECRLLQEWKGSPSPVFFDFSGQEGPSNEKIWCLLPPINGHQFTLPFLRSKFIEFLSPGSLDKGYTFSKVYAAVFNEVKVRFRFR